MNIVIDEKNFVFLIVAAFAFFVVIKTLKNKLRTIITLILAVAVILYVIGLSNMIRPANEHAKYSINYIAQQAYQNMQTHRDSVKYYYIILPIYNDITSRYSEQELLELERHPSEYMKVVKESVARNKKKIIRDLAKQKEEQLFNNFWGTWQYSLTSNKNE